MKKSRIVLLSISIIAILGLLLDSRGYLRSALSTILGPTANFNAKMHEYAKNDCPPIEPKYDRNNPIEVTANSFKEQIYIDKLKFCKRWYVSQSSEAMGPYIFILLLVLSYFIAEKVNIRRPINSGYVNDAEDYLRTMDKFTKRDNPEKVSEGRMKLYGLSILFFIAWLFLFYIFFTAKPDDLYGSMLGALMLTWPIGVYPLIRGISALIEANKKNPNSN